MKKCMVFVVVAAALTMMFTTTAFANGQFIARVNGVRATGTSGTDTAALVERLSHWEAMVAATAVDSTTPTPSQTHWATATAHATFQAVLDRANFLLDSTTFAPGDIFDVTIEMENNPGFMGMIMQFGFPTQLEVIGFDYAVLNDGATPRASILGFNSPLDIFPPHNVLPRPGGPVGGRNYFHAGWAGQRDGYNVTRNGEFFNFTVRVAAGTPVGFLPPITMSVGNAVPPHNESPSDANMQPVTILLPNGDVGGGVGASSNVVQIRVQ